jgi:cytochrome oxidase Cu insertion factor (SCO1/SenC/PrrC family)
MAEEKPITASSGAAGSNAARHRRIPLKWGLVVVAAIGGIGAGTALALVHRGGSQAASSAVGPANIAWAGGKRRAPDFALHDQAGAPISLRSAHGRVVILTFIDPLCTTLCPLEAKVLDQVEQRLPQAQRPAVMAVSVNPWGNSRRYLRDDARRWRLDRSWHWAVGSKAQLERVWRAYEIGVRMTRRVIAGVTVHQIDHTEAAYVIDPRGYERALFIYPFAASDVQRAVRQLEGARAA